MTLDGLHEGRILGLTGGIGSGKSAVAALFRQFGIPVIDVDAIAHELTAPEGKAIPAIRTEFGDGLISQTGALDRAAMRKLAFSDAGAKKRLEAILHPMIGMESQRRCRAALDTDAPYVIMEIPLLIESGTYRDRVNRILVVDCNEETQIRRVMQRSGLAREDVLRIMAAQATREQRRAVADDLIDNDGDGVSEHLVPQVNALHQKYLFMLKTQKFLSEG